MSLSERFMNGLSKCVSAICTNFNFSYLPLIFCFLYYRKCNCYNLKIHYGVIPQSDHHSSFGLPNNSSNFASSSFCKSYSFSSSSYGNLMSSSSLFSILFWILLLFDSTLGSSLFSPLSYFHFLRIFLFYLLFFF